MKIRTVYFKVSDMQKAKSFWSGFLEMKPHKDFEQWIEFQMDNIRLGFLADDYEGRPGYCRSAIMFEYPQEQFQKSLQRAVSLGARVLLDNLENPELRSMILVDPSGHEFEIGIEGTHH
jgi:predicted enzyme related to lactoylglutathione lyase